MMNAREYLDSIAVAGKRIKLKEERVQQLRESLTSVSAPMDKEQVSHTRNVSAMADSIARIIDMQHEIDQQLDHLHQLRQEAMRYFDQLDPQYSQMLTLKYYDDLTVSQIEKRLLYSRSSVFRILGEATDALQTLFEKVETK